jgi:hypothetical protein
MENPNRNEAEALLDAQEDFIIKGATDKKCPRCNDSLAYEMGDTWEITHCIKHDCVGVVAKGI